MNETLILTRGDVERLLGWDECIEAVEGAFRLHAAGKSLSPGVLGIRAPGGGFHIKAAGLQLGRLYFAAKTNANFSENPRRHQLPAIQGVIVLCDAENGRPLAVLDSMEVTLRRTAAATAVAAKYLARRDSRTATIFGCGSQGRAHLRALARVLPLTRAYVFDLDTDAARRLAADLSAELGFEVGAPGEPDERLKESDVCVTCTPSRKPFLFPGQLAPGTFLAAVGADSPDKQELDPRLLQDARVVVDVPEQCAVMGELHHAIEAGLMSLASVHAELAQVVTGSKSLPPSDRVTVFDSTGTALEDVAAAAVAFEGAVAQGVGLRVALGS